MENSVLRFQDVSFVAGKGDNEKQILTKVNGEISAGHVLAVMGPSGAGKTTLINVLTLEAYFGTPSGSVTLNTIPMTSKIFTKHAFVVKQQDKHWPYLTARESLIFSAELYEVATKENTAAVVDDIIMKMGLQSCADTKCARLSGGQKRRLSIAVALLKQPTVLFLDEPTSGLDAAAASHIMKEITRVAQEEKLIIMCTIHQPSSKVFNCFDKVMILSKGREAFAGDAETAQPYFAEIGYALPPATNPAEHYLDLVNADFTADEEVVQLLDTWQEKRPKNAGRRSSVGFGTKGISQTDNAPLGAEIAIMFRRHFSLIVRDPILYLGRCAIFFMANLVFGFVYWNAREYTQDQALNKMWVSVWFIGVPTNMGVVAVYVLNDEFKSILSESKNGMVRPISYVLAKSVMVIPIMFIFGIVALGISGFVIQDFPGESFGVVMILYATCMYVLENISEALSVWFDDPIMGMLNFLQMWFASFLFGGFLIPVRDMYWPFELFYYIMPFQYYIRSMVYALFSEVTWEYCPVENPDMSAVCVQSTSGKDVLDGMSVVMPLISSEQQYVKDIGCMLAIAGFWKILYFVGVLVKSGRNAKTA